MRIFFFNLCVSQKVPTLKDYRSGKKRIRRKIRRKNLPKKFVNNSEVISRNRKKLHSIGEKIKKKVLNFAKKWTLNFHIHRLGF